MNKKLKAIIIVISITILITGVIYAMKQINKQKTLPTATITIEEGDMDTMWVGTFEELYKEILQKENLYSGSKEFKTNDDIKVPYIEVNKDINYNELCNREIKNCGIYIDKAIQSVNFNLTERGGNLVSEAINSGTIENAISMDARKFYFTDTFVLFLKEKDKEKPYFALMVNSDEILKTI